VTQVPAQPTLTDGVVTLRPWRESDYGIAVAGHDREIAYWNGTEAAPSLADRRHLVEEWEAARAAGLLVAAFVVEYEGRPVGSVELTPAATDAGTGHAAGQATGHESGTGSGVGRLSWALWSGERGRGLATRATRLLTDWAVTKLEDGGGGLRRVEALVDARHHRSLRLAARAGLRREGVRRVETGMGDRPDATEYVVMARLASDPPLSDPEAFRAMLNSILPRKRGIGQLLVCDPDDRVLLCQLTYKRDWDLPGGVIEVGESPRDGLSREVTEELGLELHPGTLLLTDWLPPWGGWEDAICLVFDGGTHDPGLLDGVVKDPREIKGVAFCTPDEVADRAADFTTRRIAAALASRRQGQGGAYTESGRD
jgi:RimJ/RimL family protein N-acetyltransferase/8-oxo-dGTP pyrophosphatase MutT (NUDIX family)